MIELILREVRSGVFSATHDGRIIMTSRADSAMVAMRSTVGEAAKWTIEDLDKGWRRRRLLAPHPMASRRREHKTENALEPPECRGMPQEAGIAF